MVVNSRPLKRMKRRVTADLNFFTFPSGDSPVDGAFRTSVRSFLAKHALLLPPSSLLPQLLTRQILFRVGVPAEPSPESFPATVCLDVVEENVARSRSVYCDQCRVVAAMASSSGTKPSPKPPRQPLMSSWLRDLIYGEGVGSESRVDHPPRPSVIARPPSGDGVYPQPCCLEEFMRKPILPPGTPIPPDPLIISICVMYTVLLYFSL